MDFIKKQTIIHFELYEVSADIRQRKDVASQHPERVERPKKKMLLLKEEMINDERDWFE